MVDIETSNWFTSTHPHSPFVTGLIVSRQDRDGTRTSLSDWSALALTEETPERSQVTEVERDAVPGILEERFGLGGYEVGAGGRIVSAAR